MMFGLVALQSANHCKTDTTQQATQARSAVVRLHLLVLSVRHGKTIFIPTFKIGKVMAAASLFPNNDEAL